MSANEQFLYHFGGFTVSQPPPLHFYSPLSVFLQITPPKPTIILLGRKIQKEEHQSDPRSAKFAIDSPSDFG